MLIEDDSKIFGPSSIGFLPPTGSSATHIRGQWENHMCRIHAGSSKARSAQVLRNSPRAMQLSGYERVRPELTCKESALLCFHRLLTFENAKVEAAQQYIKT